MLVPLPEILFGLVEHENGQWVLKESATQEQKGAFVKFIREIRKETIIITESK